LPHDLEKWTPVFGRDHAPGRKHDPEKWTPVFAQDHARRKHMSEHRTGAPGRVKEVTSLANPLVKDIKALALKKFRDSQNAFLAEGLKLVIDALDLGWSIKTLVFAKTAIGNAAVEKVAARTVAAGGTVLEVSEKVLTAITRRDNPQSVVGVFAQRYMPLKNIRPERNDVWVALDRVRDPGNLGTVIRTVDAVGAKGLILVGETTDPFSLETVRATMGSIFAVPVSKATPEAFITWRKGFHGLVAGTHLKGAVDYRGVEFSNRPVLLMMGNEQQGLPDDLAEICDRLLRIPQAGRADSLNLAVATGVMLYEIRRSALKLDPEASA
jgi:TrmH family RNA methyltransferase